MADNVTRRKDDKNPATLQVCHTASAWESAASFRGVMFGLFHNVLSGPRPQRMAG